MKNRRGMYFFSSCDLSAGGFRTQRYVTILAGCLVVFSFIQICFLAVSLPPPHSNNDQESTAQATTISDDHGPGDSLVSSSNHHHGAEKPHPHQQLPHQQPKQIPRNLLFTHYRNLYNYTVEEYASFDEEEIVLSKNIYHSINTTHPNKVYFFTDEDCIASLSRVFPSLIPYFKNETQGMFKADICRGSTLYEYGGFYLDVDVGVRHDIWADLKSSTEFVTAKVHRKSKYPNHFFQAVLGARQQSSIIYKYLELFYDHYTGINVVEKGPLGVILLRRAWDQVYNPTTLRPHTELYAEVQYDPQMFPDLKDPPIWGRRRACRFVVIAQTNFKNRNTEFVHGNSSYYHIPFYSRIAGSRMCPVTTN